MIEILCAEPLLWPAVLSRQWVNSAIKQATVPFIQLTVVDGLDGVFREEAADAPAVHVPLLRGPQHLCGGVHGINGLEPFVMQLPEDQAQREREVTLSLAFSSIGPHIHNVWQDVNSLPTEHCYSSAGLNNGSAQRISITTFLF